jgi:hypothetical protein
MPVTAKLSRRFYEQLGDEIANELVNSFNNVDATYRSDLRELNEINFARFDAKLDQRFAEQREVWTAQLSALESRLTRWMVGLWTSTMLAMVGLLIAILRSK